MLRFPGRRHQVWLEPEGLDSDLIYPNGLSCTMPEEFQQRIIQLIPGLEQCRLVKSGYGVEYDYIDPRQLKPSLETRPIANLFLAGQINGTTGYEEAAAQGVIAGVNAALNVTGEEPFIVARTEGYVGVLIDDLTTLGTNEPYRMFPSRAEFRLSLRSDNADERLTEKGYKAGCVGKERYTMTKGLVDSIHDTTELLRSMVKPRLDWIRKLGLTVAEGRNESKSAYDALLLPGVTLDNLIAVFPEDFGHLKDKLSLKSRIEINARYSHVVAQQQIEMAEVQRDEQMLLPDDLDFMSIPSLSADVRMKLAESCPYNIAAASRIPGMTPAAIVMLLRYVKNKSKHLQS